ncbi:MAG: class I SAM-dependent methyltransferase [Anaerolineales bacterium]
MDHADHIALIRDGIAKTGGVWADFGSGSGAFTLALADLLGPGAQVYSVDKNVTVLNQQARAIRSRFPAVEMHYFNADYTGRLGLPPLDGALMANTLHFQHHLAPVLRLIRTYLKPAGRLIVVEYNLDRGNTWVPYPFSYDTWQTIARSNGFTNTRLLARRPSRFMGEIYSALSMLDSSTFAPDHFVSIVV